MPDLDVIVELIDEARAWLRTRDSNQWASPWPTPSTRAARRARSVGIALIHSVSTNLAALEASAGGSASVDSPTHPNCFKHRPKVASSFRPLTYPTTIPVESIPIPKYVQAPMQDADARNGLALVLRNIWNALRLAVAALTASLILGTLIVPAFIAPIIGALMRHRRRRGPPDWLATIMYGYENLAGVAAAH